MRRVVAVGNKQANHRDSITVPAKVCFVGLGIHGLGQVKRILNNPQMWSPVGVVDSSVAAYARFQYWCHQSQVPYFRSVTEAIRNMDAGTFVVATTAPSHVAIVKEIISTSAAKFVLVEKPISTNLGEARQLRAMLNSNNWPGTVGVDFNRRCSGLYAHAREIIHSGELGGLVRIVYSRPCKVSMKGAHYIDMANWIIDSTAMKVTANLDDNSTIDHRGSVFFDPEGHIDVAYENGASFTFDGRGTSTEFDHGMHIICERGSIFLDVAESFGAIDGPSGHRRIASDKEGDAYNWFESTLEALVFGSNHYSAATVDESIDCLEITVAAHLSDQLKGEPISLPLDREFDAISLRIA